MTDIRCNLESPVCMSYFLPTSPTHNTDIMVTLPPSMAFGISVRKVTKLFEFPDPMNRVTCHYSEASTLLLVKDIWRSGTATSLAVPINMAEEGPFLE